MTNAVDGSDVILRLVAICAAIPIALTVLGRIIFPIYCWMETHWDAPIQCPDDEEEEEDEEDLPSHTPRFKKAWAVRQFDSVGIHHSKLLTYAHASYLAPIGIVSILLRLPSRKRILRLSSKPAAVSN